MKLKYRCLISGCDFDSETRIGLQKHYEQDHTYTERVKSSLVLSGGEYLPLTHRGHSEDVRKKLAAIIMLVCGLMMITAHLPVNFAVAADEGGSGDSGGGGDSGGDSGGGGDSGSNDGGGDSGGSKDDSGGGGEDKQESSSNDGEDTQQGTSEDGKESNDAPQDDQKKEKEWTGSHRSIDQGSPLDDRFKEAREKEKAAVEDYIHEEPGIVKPYPPVKDKPYISVKPGTVFDKPKHVGSPYLGKGGGKGDGGHSGGDNNYNWCKYHKCGDGGHDDHNDHHSHGDHDHHHNHGHNYHNDHHHYDNNNHNYYYYYSNDYSHNHATVILQLDYSQTNDVHDVNIEIGNDFDANFDLAGEPENLVITGLDLDDGENFDVCIENDGQVNCEQGHINNQDDVDYVDIRIP